VEAAGNSGSLHDAWLANQAAGAIRVFPAAHGIATEGYKRFFILCDLGMISPIKSGADYSVGWLKQAPPVS